MTSGELMAGVDLRKLRVLKHKYPYGPEKNPTWLKFADWQKYAPNAIQWVERAGISRDGPRLDILDVGCGWGYFVRACRLMGHDAWGLDFDDPLYREVWGLMDVPVVCHAITCGVPFPDDLGPFDVVTMFGFGLPRVLQENGHRSAKTWAEYREPLVDLLRLIRPGGYFYAVVNVGDRPWLFGHPDWYALAAEVGGKLTIYKNTFRIDMP